MEINDVMGEYFPNLKELLLDDNMLEVIPRSICRMKRLVLLSLISNPIKRLPPEIIMMHELEILRFDWQRYAKLGFLSVHSVLEDPDLQLDELNLAILRNITIRKKSKEGVSFEEYYAAFNNTEPREYSIDEAYSEVIAAVKR